MIMNCPEEGRLRAYLDHQAPVAEQAEIENHLAECVRCGVLVAGLRAAVGDVAAALEQVAVPTVATDAAWQRFAARRPALSARPEGSPVPPRVPGRTFGTSGGQASPGKHVPLLSRVAWAVQRVSRTVEYSLHLLLWRLSTMFRDFRGRGWQVAVPAAVIALMLVGVITVAPLRAAAGQFLDVFRVKRLAVVQVQTGQLEKLQQYRDQVFSKPQVQRAKPVEVRTAAEAAKEAQLLKGNASLPSDFHVLTPGFLPSELGAPQKFTVQGSGQAITQVNLQAARMVLQMANLPTDALPAGQGSIQVTANLKPGVAQEYQAGGHTLEIVQTQNPEVQVPDGVDLAKLNEVGLQLLGLSPDAAKRLSQNVDWATTLILPVPTDIGSVRDVTVHGNPGYLITQTRESKRGTGGPGSIVMWQENNWLYAVAGNYSSSVLLQVAESLK
jgi:hypothetical protein